MLFLNGKTILLTGASKGLGARLARELWDSGANLFLISRTSFNNKLIKKFENQKYVWYFLDLSSEFKEKEIFACFFENFDDLDVIINNAAIQMPIENSWEGDWKDWRKNIEVNLFSPVKIMRAFIP